MPTLRVNHAFHESMMLSLKYICIVSVYRLKHDRFAVSTLKIKKSGDPFTDGIFAGSAHLRTAVTAVTTAAVVRIRHISTSAVGIML